MTATTTQHASPAATSRTARRLAALPNDPGLDDILADPNLTSTAKALITVMVRNWAWFKDDCWPSDATLAARLGMSVGHVQRCLRELERAGRIFRERTAAVPNGRRIWLLCAAPAAAPCAPDPRGAPPPPRRRGERIVIVNEGSEPEIPPASRPRLEADPIPTALRDAPPAAASTFQAEEPPTPWNRFRRPRRPVRRRRRPCRRKSAPRPPRPPLKPRVGSSRVPPRRWSRTPRAAPRPALPLPLPCPGALRPPAGLVLAPPGAWATRRVRQRPPRRWFRTPRPPLPLDLGASGRRASFSPPPGRRGPPRRVRQRPRPRPLRRHGPVRGVRAWAWTWPSCAGRGGDGRPDPGGRAGAAHGAAAAARAAAADAAEGRAGGAAPRPARPDHGGGAAAERGDGGLPAGEPADVRDDGRRRWRGGWCRRRCCSTAGVRGWVRRRGTRGRCWWRRGSVRPPWRR